MDHVINVLAASVEHVNDCPDSDTRYSAILFGRIAGSAEISTRDLTLIQMFMDVAYENNVTEFNKGLAHAKATARAHAMETKPMGTHGGKVPTKEEAARILEEKGMPWQEVVAVSSVLFNGTVPTLGEIERVGYGSDPGQWDSAKEWRKQGKPNLHSFVKNKDASGYKAMVARGATRLAANGEWSSGAAGVMLFVTKLSRMTFDQGMSELFMEYCEEHHETYKGRGLANKSNPLDQAILTETVLAAKAQVHSSDDKLNKVMEAVEAQDSKMDQRIRSRLGELSAVVTRVSQLETKMNHTGSRGGPPSAENPCGYCGAIDHFIRDCPKKKEADARKASASNDKKSE